MQLKTKAVDKSPIKGRHEAPSVIEEESSIESSFESETLKEMSPAIRTMKTFRQDKNKLGFSSPQSQEFAGTSLREMQ